MRRLGFVIVGLGAGACFDGGDATGFPCTEDAQCGAGIACLDGVCGGATPTSSAGTTLPDSSSGASMSTSSPDSSSGSDTTATSTGSGTTGDVPSCQPTPIPLCTPGARRTDRGNFRVETVSSLETAVYPIARPSSVVTGDFDGDARSDLALIDFETWRLHIFFNRDLAGWTEYPNPPRAVGDGPNDVPYDVVATDLDCMGGTDFVVASQNPELVIHSFADEPFPVRDAIASHATGFSLAVGDLVADESFYPDVVLAVGGIDAGAQLFVNTQGVLTAEPTLTSAVDEPWETVIFDTVDGPLILVAQGRNAAFGAATDRVRVLRVVDEGNGPELVEPMDLRLPVDLASPWAMAIGNFIGNASVELAVGERHVDADAEETSTNGTVRIFSFQGVNAETPWIESTPTQGVLTVGKGLVSMSAADLDCDGFDDIVVGRSGDSTIPTGDGSFPAVLYGAELADGIEIVEVPLDVPMAAGSRHAVADFDLDGALEVAIADFGFVVPGARVLIVSLAQ